MQITSDSLFHFTDSLKNLESILKKKFHLTYCNERFELLDEKFNEHFPMISFCDLPLGLIRPHIEKYGSYGIGMTKQWGIKNMLNPVLYLEKNSIITKDIGQTLKNISNLIDTLLAAKEKANGGMMEELNKFDGDITANAETYFNIFRYIKNYKGELKRKNKTYKDYRFYDEREWRYLPPFKDESIKPTINEEEYKKYRGNSKIKPLITGINLNFNSSDIKYLIVKSEKDIPKLIRTIKSIDNLSKNPNESDILTTKILTFEQLKSDF